MRVLVACEMSGRVRDAFIARGHDAVSCDIFPSELPGPHIQDDVLRHLDDGWDLMVCFPPCTDLACSGAKHFWRKRDRQEEALRFVLALMGAPIGRIAMENPVGVISTRIRKPDQIVQPWMFGDAAQKTTCLWLKNLPPLVPEFGDDPLFGTRVDKGEFVTTPSGKRLPKWYSDNTDPKNRSRTFPGIARAMAARWG